MISREKLARFCQWLKKKSFVICCGIAPVILLSALLITSDFGCNVIVDGKIIGTAPSEKYVLNLVDSINEELAPYLGGSDAITVRPTTTPKLVVGKNFSSSHELGEALKQTCPLLEKAYSVKSGDKTVVAFSTKEERQKLYNQFIKKMTNGSKSYEILDNISFKYELVPYGLIKSGDAASKMLERTYKFSDEISINKNCDIDDILTSYAICEDDFKEQNPGFKEGETKKVKITSNIPYIRVLSKKSRIENTVIRHTVKYEMDADMYKGESEIKSDGEDGIKKAYKTKYSLNGTLLYDNLDKEEITEPCTQVILIGGKEQPKGKSTGSISKPCNGNLSSRFGTRGSRQHRGIDITGKEDTPIYAADGGTVTYAGWDNSGYGNVIKIDHKNGYTSLYAHCNGLYVKEGDSVAKGDIIAGLGNTGRSTGPHLHFEVYNTKTRVAVNPLNFFSMQ